ncbi:hypothetical protein [Paenibacillus chungangensis]|uniref:F5/8 type C domain-containing protein n=1 Tax=Paenibacillus chungangensis TaxID=696535 RepID=A0ABW3HUT7_9BACL
MMPSRPKSETLHSFSGVYPHLACTNGTADQPEWECGIGAVAAWNDKLWYMTYPAHCPFGSEDKLYSLDKEMRATVHPKSVGGTHASRMIHCESGQLIIGPYFIDRQDHVRAIPPSAMEGRLTGVARHLTDPANKVIFYTMESGLYEVDVHTLEVNTLYRDPNALERLHGNYLLPGVHGKGAYTGQERLVVSNNGEGGALAEWLGVGSPGDKDSWRIIDANKYTEVTGPGGLYGAPDQDAPIWALGWDDKSVLLQVCHRREWKRYRLPMASFTHIADNGWFTEWPRIRDIGAEKWLMDMFGMLYEFPPAFSHDHTAGIRPLSVHHGMIVDYEQWDGQLVLGCNDASVQYNPLTGRCQSNLLFTSFDKLKTFGQPSGWGCVWSQEAVEAGIPSEPFHFAGFEQRVLHVSHTEPQDATFRIQLDLEGNGKWTEQHQLLVPAGGYRYYIFPEGMEAEWVRLVPLEDIGGATAAFSYHQATDNPRQEGLIAGLTDAGDTGPHSDAILYASDDMRLPLHLAATQYNDEGEVVAETLYELQENIRFTQLDDDALHARLREELAPAPQYELDDASVIVTNGEGRRYRLPKGHSAYDGEPASGYRRMIREVVTERSLMNVHGTFYELPDEHSGGLHRIQPICTHNKLIHDFCSWRGMLVLSGIAAETDASYDSSEHIVRSDDGTAALWLGNVDDLRSFGAPCGTGGPWLQSEAAAGIPSDPYLMRGYRHKRLELSHSSTEAVEFTVEVDFQGNDTWAVYGTLTAVPGETLEHEFPAGYAAQWVRLASNRNTVATATFYYNS